VGAVPRIRFGLAFCEASGKRLVRWSGNDELASPELTGPGWATAEAPGAASRLLALTRPWDFANVRFAPIVLQKSKTERRRKSRKS